MNNESAESKGFTSARVVLQMAEADFRKNAGCIVEELNKLREYLPGKIASAATASSANFEARTEKKIDELCVVLKALASEMSSCHEKTDLLAKKIKIDTVRIENAAQKTRLRSDQSYWFSLGLAVFAGFLAKLAIANI